MTRLEMIEIRTTEKNNAALEAYLASWQTEVYADEKAPLVKIYRHAALDTDFSIHLRYDAQTNENDFSVLSERLSAALKEFGLVNHTVWIERRLKEK